MQYIDGHDMCVTALGILIFVLISMIAWWIVTKHEHEG